MSDNRDVKGDIVLKTAAKAAYLFGVQTTTIQNWGVSGMPGRKGNYSLKAMIEWVMYEGPCHHKKSRGRPVMGISPSKILANGGKIPKDIIGGDDPLLTVAAGDSVGLERYRMAKAALAELELAQKRDSTINVERLRQIHSRWATILKAAAERVQRRFGKEAGVMMFEAIEECSRIIDTLQEADGSQNGHE